MSDVKSANIFERNKEQWHLILNRKIIADFYFLLLLCIFRLDNMSMYHFYVEKKIELYSYFFNSPSNGGKALQAGNGEQIAPTARELLG